LGLSLSVGLRLASSGLAERLAYCVTNRGEYLLLCHR
jgi:hypothetical protein